MYLRALLACFALCLIAATPQPAAEPVSPSAVLQKVDESLGSQNIYFPSNPKDRQELSEDKTVAPYFYVAGGDPETERLPLKETSAEVQIAGVIAKAKVRQVFVNTGSKPIEAIYVFPASTRAAVHGMRMKIGKRTIEARIDRKQAAREQYEQAKKEGKRASLLEQERPNVFTMNVANIMPKDRIEVELDYSELLIPDDATYEFIHPTVVGPRYGGGADAKKDKWIANPYMEKGAKEPYKFDIKVHVETGIPLKELTSPSHKVDVKYLTKSSADVTLAQDGGGNKDYILRYRLAGDEVETGLLLYKGAQENFFVMMMEPPARPNAGQIPPREYIFLLDVSGSMHGFPLNTAKVLAKSLLSQLNPSDLFNIAMFSGESFVLSPEGSLAATEGNIKMAVEIMDHVQGGGGTELMGGLKSAYGIPKRNKQYSRSVIVVTDGYVGIEAAVFKFIREHLNEANLFSFGIGSAVNRGLIEGMARAGMGEPFVVLNENRAAEQAERMRQYIQYPVLSNIEVSMPGFDAKEVAPAKLPDLMARRPVVLFGKYKGEPKGKITVSGYSGGGKVEKTVEITPAAVKAENAPIRFLWARKWVGMLDDELAMTKGNKDIEEAITNLGLSYTLLTDFTSFVAVDSEVVNKQGDLQTVNQALPMPEGVSNLAVPGSPSPKKMAMPMRQMRAEPEEKEVAAPSAMPPAPPPSTTSSAAAHKGRIAKTMNEEDAGGAPSGALRLMILELKPSGIADTAALVKAIEAKLEGDVAKCAEGGTVTLRLTIDKNGKITKVEVVKASGTKLDDCLKKNLIGLSATSRPSSDTGTLELTIRAMRLR